MLQGGDTENDCHKQFHVLTRTNNSEYCRVVSIIRQRDEYIAKTKKNKDHERRLVQKQLNQNICVPRDRRGASPSFLTQHYPINGTLVVDNAEPVYAH